MALRVVSKRICTAGIGDSLCYTITRTPKRNASAMAVPSSSLNLSQQKQNEIRVRKTTILYAEYVVLILFRMKPSFQRLILPRILKPPPLLAVTLPTW